MTMGELIASLSKVADQATIVTYGLGEHHSWRGDYEQGTGLRRWRR